MEKRREMGERREEEGCQRVGKKKKTIGTTENIK